MFIPSGTVTVDSDNKYSCNAFWMASHEVTNLEYRGFLASLKAEDRMDDYKKAVPDTMQWMELGGFMDKMTNMYFWHPAFNNYPVVNISKEGAQLYCKYATEEYRKIYGDVIQDFRLPTRLEWMYAASSGKSNQTYPWNGPYLRNEKGEFLANFRPVGDRNITMTENGPEVVADSLMMHQSFHDGGFFTVASDSYQPNEFGLYHMSGNVAEMVAKEDVVVGGSWGSPGYDIRIQSTEKFEKPNPFTGFRPVLSFIKQDN